MDFLIKINSFFYMISMSSFFIYYAYKMNDTRIYAIEFSSVKDLKIRKWRNNFLMVILIFLWSFGWKFTPQKPEALSTMKAELFFLLGYFIIYYIINIVTKEINKKNYIEKCENKLIILFSVLGISLFFIKPVEFMVLNFTIYFIVLQIILKLFVILKFKYLKIKKGLHTLYLTFFILSIVNNLMNLIYLFDIELFWMYSIIRSIWEFVIGVWSIYGIMTIKKARSVI